MKKIVIYVALLAIMLAAIIVQAYIIKSEKAENARLVADRETLLIENNAILAEKRKYIVDDSLKAIQITGLHLSLAEYKKYREADLALINKLKADKRDMAATISAQLESINTLKSSMKDTVIVKDSTSLAAKAFEYHSRWTDITGLITFNPDSISLSIKNKEELLIVESVKRKRFLGFLWKTKKVKSRTVDVVSKNPNTEIVTAKYDYIEN